MDQERLPIRGSEGTLTPTLQVLNPLALQLGIVAGVTLALAERLAIRRRRGPRSGVRECDSSRR